MPLAFKEVMLILLTVKYWVRIDDSMDVFAEHGIAGMIGLMWNALFGVDYVIGLDGVNTGVPNPTTGTGIGGWPIGNYRQFYIQLAYILACTGYAFVMSAILAYIVNYIPGLHLRASEEAELLGMDDDQLGEFAYDYVEVCTPQIDSLGPPAYMNTSQVRRGLSRLGHHHKNADSNGIDPDLPHEHRFGTGDHSDMIRKAGSGNDDSMGSSDTQHQDMPAQGDRHAVKAEDKEKHRDHPDV